jgi:hypothetical protein
MTIEIVDLPINSMVIFHSYVSLPEGTSPLRHRGPGYMPTSGFFFTLNCTPQVSTIDGAFNLNLDGGLSGKPIPN